MADGIFHGNGIDADTGDPLLQPGGAEALAAAICKDVRSDSFEPDFLKAVRDRADRDSRKYYGLPPDRDTLAVAGWTLVFPAARPGSEEARRNAAILEALGPLVARRQEQAPGRVHVIHGASGIRPGEPLDRFKARNYVQLHESFYLLLVGSPAEISFDVQLRLGLHHSVGRLDLDGVDAFAAYARVVADAEAGAVARPRELVAVAPVHPNDPTTAGQLEHLVDPLTRLDPAGKTGWQIRLARDEAASKAAVVRLLTAAAGPAVVFMAGHGLGFAAGDPRQAARQGAFVCQDWPGPGRPVDPAWVLAADDLGDDADLRGRIVVQHAAFSAGTAPPASGPLGSTARVSPGFVSALHRRLLGHPRGGALAAVGLVGAPFVDEGLPDDPRARPVVARRRALHERVLRGLLAGYRIGEVCDLANNLHAEAASDLQMMLEELEFGRKLDAAALGDLWAARAFATSVVLSGDPAVRAAVR
jgi:hypothetical protein